ncbi:MAG: tRNA lysidine(34) synthetase TilS [Armatimonadota bacterium]
MSEERDALHEHVLEALERYDLLEGAGSVLVGVSGGQDSVALLHSLRQLQPQLRGRPRLAAVHVHHGMRGARADADVDCVRGLCETLGVECFVAHRDVPAESARSGLNAEQAGRLARYEEYERVASEQGFDRIATGHTGTDRAETLLLNLFRGAGLRGMSSIPPRRGAIIRPLILATREETAEYCRRHALEVCTDASNLDPEYARRNLVRLRLLPLIAEHFPEAERALMRACEAVEEELAWTEPLLRAALEGATLGTGGRRLRLDAARLGREHDGALHLLLRMALERVRGDLEGLSREHIERIAELTRMGTTGSVVELPGQLRVRKEYDALVIEPDELPDELPDESVTLAIPGEATLARRGVTVSAEPAGTPAGFADDAMTVYVSAGATEAGLVLRSHRPGERFVPLGMTGSRKLQDFFVDEKVPRQMRDRIPVVADAGGRVLWVVGCRLAEPARAEVGGEAVRLSARFEPWTKEDA